MRLVCPNCAAQYNVDDRVIPPGGRDVQCSNCGHTWFQTAANGGDRPRVRPAGAAAPREAAEAAQPAAQEPAAAAAPATSPAPATEPPAPRPPAPPPAAAQAAAPAAGRGLPSVDEDEDWEDDEPIDHLPPTRGDAAPASGPASPPAATEARQAQGRRVLDEAVLAILREEAEREARARKAESQAVETQEDLGLPAPAPVPRKPEPQPAMAEPPRPAREVLPDVEEITSTLAARDLPEDAEGPGPAARRRSGFRLGFGLVLFLALGLLALYLLAPTISAAAPDLAGPMGDYVAAVDAARVRLEEALRGLLAPAE